MSATPISSSTSPPITAPAIAPLLTWCTGVVAVVVAGARELTGAAATDVDEATAWVDCEVAEAAVVAKEAEVEAAVGLVEAEVVDAEAGAVPFLPQSVKDVAVDVGESDADAVCAAERRVAERGDFAVVAWRGEVAAIERRVEERVVTCSLGGHKEEVDVRCHAPFCLGERGGPVELGAVESVDGKSQVRGPATRSLAAVMVEAREDEGSSQVRMVTLVGGRAKGGEAGDVGLDHPWRASNIRFRMSLTRPAALNKSAASGSSLQIRVVDLPVAIGATFLIDCIQRTSGGSRLLPVRIPQHIDLGADHESSRGWMHLTSCPVSLVREPGARQ
ncbi:hypothetical protein L1887_61611 [Cichorium endivia]|nr:hypothetical protein L1887_61611 [Cichorium endivia]